MKIWNEYMGVVRDGADFSDNSAELSSSPFYTRLIPAYTGVQLASATLSDGSTQASPQYVGGGGDDLFIGTEASDNASGGGGNDTLIGNGGNDFLAGDDGADYLEGGAGDDIMFSKTMDPSAFAYISYRAVSNDYGTEVDTLVGGAGDDYMVAGYGDNVDGGTYSSFGNRLYITFRGATSGVNADFRLLQTQGSITIGGGLITNIQTVGFLEGSQYDDLLVPIDTYYPTGANVYGLGGNDHIIGDYYSGWGGSGLYGGDGNDIIDGRPSQYGPNLYGEAGNDTLYMGNGFGSASGGDGDDTIYASYTANGDAGNDTIVMQNSYYSFFVHGGTGDDTIIASQIGNNGSSIFGDEGNDTFIGNDGYDTFVGGAGNDVINGAGQSVTGSGYSGDVSVYSGNVQDYLVTQDPNTLVVTVFDKRAGSPDGTDTLTGIEILKFANGAYSLAAVLSGQATGVSDFVGTPGPDTYYGSENANTAIGYAGADTFYGFGGNDTMQGNAGADFIDGGSGDDTLYSGDQTGAFNAPYYGNPWTAPTLDTGSEVDTLIGGDGNDTLFAGYGDNVDGGLGGDSLYISFMGASSGVTVDFRQASVGNGGGTISGIENVNWVQGSNFDDDITLGGGNGYGSFTPVFGMGGNDHLVAGYYTGYMDGGDGNDVVDGRGSQYLQTVIGGAGDDTLYTNTNTFASAVGGDGNDTIYAHAAIDGGAGNDTIYIQASYYPGQVHGGDGDDTIYTATNQGHSAVFGDAGKDTLIGGTGDDTLDGGDDDDTIDGGAGLNTLRGGAGNDRLVMGFGSSGTVLDGGTGTDTLVVTAAVQPSGTITSIEAIELSGGGVLTLSSAQAYGLPSNAGISGTGAIIINQQPGIAIDLSNYVIAPGANVAFTLNGSGSNDTMHAANAATTLNGGSGNDTLYGGSGADTLAGGSGIDTLYGNGGNDRLVVDASGSGSTVDGGIGTDTLAVSGAVSLGGITSIEAIEFTAGSNLTLSASQVASGLALNTLLSGTGTLTINLEAGVTTTMTGFQGAGAPINVVVNGSSGDDFIKASHFSNNITGGLGRDFIRGGNGVDTIDGGADNDKITGWGGADILTGGGGADQFRYLVATDSGVGAAADRITDFTIGSDVIDLRLLDSDLVTPDIQNYSLSFIGTAAFGAGGAGQIRTVTSGSDMLVQFDLDGNGTSDMEILLQSLAGQTLSASDFLGLTTSTGGSEPLSALAVNEPASMPASALVPSDPLTDASRGLLSVTLEATPAMVDLLDPQHLFAQPQHGELLHLV